jgi:putative endonuclease
MSDKARIGAAGENLAAEHFASLGFTVVARNFRYGKAEIDLIVQRENWLIFVEVKTRNSSAFGQPETFVTDYQRRLIFSAAEEYIFRYDWKGHIRFDIISVTLGDPPKLDHFEDAIS